MLRAVAAPLLDWHVSGVENIPRQGPLLAIVNHSSWLDIVLPGLFFTRPVVGFIKEETFHSYPLAWLLQWMKFIPLRRGEVDRAALGRAIQARQAGAAFVLSPEGTRPPDGRLIQAKPGVALLADASRAPILPMAFAGAQRDTFTKNLRAFRRTRIDIRIGEPLTLQVERVDRACRQQVVDELMLYIAQLLPEEQRGYYANMNFGSPRYFNRISLRGPAVPVPEHPSGT